MPEGTVKFFNRAKGFGFIVPDDGGKEIFLPPAALGEAGNGVKLSPGQRVAFDVVDDPKGPKAAALKLLGEAPVRPPQPAQAPKPPAPRPPAPVSLFCEPATAAAQAVLAALEDAGQQVQVVDVGVSPPAVAQLKKWSQLLGAQGQELVRRNAGLFFDLQLDDRFIHEDEFWTAVGQHPALLSGPILAGRERVRICRTAADVMAFFAAGESNGAQGKPKEISSRLMAMMRGEAVGPRPVPVMPAVEDLEEEEFEEELEEEEEQEEPEEASPVKAAKKPAAKAPKPAAKKAAPAKAAAKKPAVKKAVAKPAAKKAVKKAK